MALLFHSVSVNFVFDMQIDEIYQKKKKILCAGGVRGMRRQILKIP